MANHVYVTQGQTTSYPADPYWYLDTGAIDHLFGELEKMQLKDPYLGKECVHTADGSGMPILHVGQALLPTPYKPLHLRNVLHVPSVTKNLLSVRKLTHDNHVFIEFHPNSVFVKDLDTRAILLSGRCRGGLYALDDPAFKQVFSALKALFA
jgi:histone deacetylase 1/2